MEPIDFDKRFEALEIRLAYLEDFLGRLQDQVVERGAQTDRLAAEHGALKEKVLLLAAEQEEVPSRKPPHY
jgi:SlyX protein